MPGVFVQETNHGGGLALFAGPKSNQTLMMPDGIQLNKATEVPLPSLSHYAQKMKALLLADI